MSARVDRGWHLSQHLACVASEPTGVERHRFRKPHRDISPTISLFSYASPNSSLGSFSLRRSALVTCSLCATLALKIVSNCWRSSGCLRNRETRS